MKVAVSRKEHFNAAHRLFNSTWTDEKNEAIFGKCSNPNYHGHNYELIVTVLGEPNPDTGYVYDMKLLSEVIKEHVTTQFDHKNLNLDTVFFKNLNPTAENIAIVIWRILRQHIDNQYELKIKLYEWQKCMSKKPLADLILSIDPLRVSLRTSTITIKC